MAKFHENIVVHDLLHFFISRDLKGHDLPIAELFIMDSAFFERNQSTTFVLISLCKVNEKALKLIDSDLTSGMFVIFPP